MVLKSTVQKFMTLACCKKSWLSEVAHVVLKFSKALIFDISSNNVKEQRKSSQSDYPPKLVEWILASFG